MDTGVSGCHTCNMWTDWLNRDEPEGPAENENPELYRKVRNNAAPGHIMSIMFADRDVPSRNSENKYSVYTI